jgi:peptide/nickel transport system permease protein
VIPFLLRRLVWAAGTVVLTAFFAYGLMRGLRPEQYPGDAFVSGTWHQMSRALFHLDFGEACMFAGCPKIHDLWLRGLWVDVYLLAGGITVGLTLGVGGGLWCAARPRSLGARVLEGLSMVFFCAPAYVVGLLALLMFAPDFGLIKLPYFFDINSYKPPGEDLWDFFRTMLAPWIAVGLPVAGQFLRLTRAIAHDNMGEDFIRTARAKGVPENLVVRRHAGPPTRVAVASLFGASAPIMITNMVLVEWVFTLPGFFRHLRRALGQNLSSNPALDIPTVQALAIWAAVLILAVSLLADIAIVKLDPRIRAGHTAPPG